MRLCGPVLGRCEATRRVHVHLLWPHVNCECVLSSSGGHSDTEEGCSSISAVSSEQCDFSRATDCHRRQSLWRQQYKRNSTGRRARAFDTNLHLHRPSSKRLRHNTHCSTNWHQTAHREAQGHRSPGSNYLTKETECYWGQTKAGTFYLTFPTFL